MRVRVLGLDPGSQKMGLAVWDTGSHTILQRTIAPATDIDGLLALIATWEYEVIAVGNATGGRQVTGLLKGAQQRGELPRVPILSVDERNSTLEGRQLYWKAVPRTGWRRLVPLGLQTPPVPVDDFAAAVVASRARPGDSSGSWDEFLTAWRA